MGKGQQRMIFARGSDAAQIATAWGCAGLSVGAFVWDGLTPVGGFQGRVAIGLAVVAVGIFVGLSQRRAVRTATRELSTCVDKTIGTSVQFGRDSERRRHDDRGDLATVRPFVPRNSKGGK